TPAFDRRVDQAPRSSGYSCRGSSAAIGRRTTPLLKIIEYLAERVLIFGSRGFSDLSRIFLGEVGLVPVLHRRRGGIGCREVLLGTNGGDPALYRRLVVESQF